MKLDVSVIDVDMSDSDVAITAYKTAKAIKVNMLEKQVYGNKAFLMLNHEQAKQLIKVLQDQLQNGE